MDQIKMFIQDRKFLILLILVLSILQSCTSDNTLNLGKGYFYRDEGNIIKDILNKNSNDGEVPATVLSYDYDNNFIIAKQQPNLPQDILYEKEYHYELGEDTIHYWLIIKRDNLVLGPLTEVEFKKVKQQYKVPDKLKFK